MPIRFQIGGFACAVYYCRYKNQREPCASALFAYSRSKHAAATHTHKKNAPTKTFSLCPHEEECGHGTHSWRTSRFTVCEACVDVHVQRNAVAVVSCRCAITYSERNTRMMDKYIYSHTFNCICNAFMYSVLCDVYRALLTVLSVPLQHSVRFKYSSGYPL